MLDCVQSSSALHLSGNKIKKLPHEWKHTSIPSQQHDVTPCYLTKSCIMTMVLPFQQVVYGLEQEGPALV